MSSILINNVLLNSQRKNVLIEGNRFKSISSLSIAAPGAQIIDGSSFAIVPPFYNGHCHAAMNLLKGYADDMQLQPWLNNAIWPMEAKLTAHDIYVGSRLALLEMIKSGTVFFCDMYFEEMQTIRACHEMGVRAAIGVSVMTTPSDWTSAKLEERFQRLANYAKLPPDELISYAVAPHAPYTVSDEVLVRCQQVADDLGFYLTIHLAETQGEFDSCRQLHNGLTPVQHLNSLGLLHSKSILAHVVYVTPQDREILAQTQAVSVHNPISNMKLASGAFHLQEMEKAGCRVILGTDGSSSNNNLDMLEEMKVAALLAKLSSANPEVASATSIFDRATRQGAEAFGIDAGVIAEGKLADALLVNLNDVRMVPNYNLISNLVYSADSSVIDTVICNGRIIMQDRVVPGEADIIAEAKEVVAKLVS